MPVLPERKAQDASDYYAVICVSVLLSPHSGGEMGKVKEDCIVNLS